MNILLIPIIGTSASFSQRLTLGNTLYIFLFNWSDAEARWFLNIMDQTNNPILMGIVMNTDEDLIGRFRVSVPALPQGFLFLHDMTLLGIEAGRNSLGKTHLLLFAEV